MIGSEFCSSSFLAFINKNFCCLWQEKLLSPLGILEPQTLSLKSSDLSSTPQRVADENGKILCLYITRQPMISLYLLNYRYDSLSQIPTLRENLTPEIIFHRCLIKTGVIT